MPSSDRNTDLARQLAARVTADLNALVDDECAVWLLLTGALGILMRSGMTSEEAAARLHALAADCHQTEVHRLRDAGLQLS
jgi:hypothetical protein